jgi:hypothetical protein
MATGVIHILALAVIRESDATLAGPLLPPPEAIEHLAEALAPLTDVTFGGPASVHLQAALDSFREATALEPERERQSSWTRGRVHLDLARQHLKRLLGEAEV